MIEGDPGPAFIGGTGRCGTHAVAALAASGGHYAAVPAELRLHVSESGLPAFAAGILDRRDLVRALRTQWWRHSPEWDPTAARGIHRIAPRTRYSRALARLATARPGADRVALSRRLVTDLLDPLAPSPRRWVEKSPANCAHAGFLAALFPRMRLIHIIRDGRDVACSMMRVPWAPDDFASALAMWERSLLAAHRGTLRVPAGSVHTVSLEDLIVTDRDRARDSLLRFLGIAGDARARSFFERELTPDRARIGRWRSELPRWEHDQAQRLYGHALRRLADAGVSLPVASTSDDPVTVPPAGPSPIDPWAPSTSLRTGT